MSVLYVLFGMRVGRWEKESNWLFWGYCVYFILVFMRKYK